MSTRVVCLTYPSLDGEKRYEILFKGTEDVVFEPDVVLAPPSPAPGAKTELQNLSEELARISLLLAISVSTGAVETAPDIALLNALIDNCNKAIYVLGFDPSRTLRKVKTRVQAEITGTIEEGRSTVERDLVTKFLKIAI